MTGSALNWFVTYSSGLDLSTISFASFVSEFRRVHIGKLDTYDIIQKLSSMKQAQSIENYITEFDNFRRLLPSGSLSEDMFIQLFVKGLKPNTRKELRLRSISSFYEATQLASRAEHCLYTDGFSIGSPAPANSAFDADGDVVMAVHGHRSHSRHRPRSSHYSRPSSSRNAPDQHWRNKYREVCMKQRLCFQCMSPNHQSAQCTQNASSPTPHY